MMTKLRSLFVLLMFSAVLGLGAFEGFGAEMKGMKFPDQLDVGEKKLVLNGLGLRLATFLKIKVYVGALYLERRSPDPSAILASPELKRVEMAFVRGVGAGKLRAAWPDDLQANCSSGCGVFSAAIQQLQSMMTDMSDGDRMAFDFYPDHVDVWIKGKLVGSIRDGHGFSAQLLKDWIGHAPNDELKSGMLGR